MRKKTIRKRLPSLSYADSTGWYFSWISDPSHPSGRRRHYWSKDKAEAIKEYNANIEKLVAEYAQRVPETPLEGADSWSLVDLADAFYRQKVADGRRPATLGNVKKYLPDFMQWLKGRGFDPAVRRPDELTTAHLGAYRDSLAKKPNIGRIEANHYIEQVRGLLTWGRETHGLQVPPLGVIKKFPAEAKNGHGTTQDRTPVGWKDIKALLAAADPVDLAILMLGLNCGFGNMDVGALELDAVDLDAGTISDRRHKTGVPRDFFLWPETVAALKVYLRDHRGKPRNLDFAKRFLIGRRGNPMCWEYVNAKGERIRSDAVKNRFDKLLKRAGVDLPTGAGFYILRHTYATLIGQESNDAREVQAAMAHATMQQQETYRHDRAEKAGAAQARLGRTFHARLPKRLLRRIGGGKPRAS